MTPHIEAKKEDIANIVLMPGDPNRAKYIAENFLENSRQVNSLRGEYAYTGEYKGKRITIFSSGMGMASMGIYSYELFEFYDVDAIIRIGTAGSYTEDIKVNDIIVADSAYSTTNYDMQAIGENQEIINASFELNSVIMQTAHKKRINAKFSRVHTTEAFYGIVDERMLKQHNCSVVEMEAYALFLNAKRFFKKATAILTISDNLVTKEAMAPEIREKKLDEMIILALESVINLQF